MEKTNKAPASKILSGARNGEKASSLILNIQNGEAEQCPKVLKWRVTQVDFKLRVQGRALWEGGA